ncbi:MAG: hypothetical protein IAE80_23955 [Anaerolinea sp.]|nr:hypothetical protein [Anaerolinea sp.]
MSTTLKLLMTVVLTGLIVGVVVLMLAQSTCTVAEDITATTRITLQPTPTPSLIDAPKIAPDCRVSGTGIGDVIVRSYPGSTYAELGIITDEVELTALGATDDGWLTVSYGERRGWVRREVISTAGRCDALPAVRNPTIPVAPADQEVFGVQIDRDASGEFVNAISAPDGDGADLLWVSVINLYTQPPNNMRQFTLTLECTGANVEAVRWGWAYTAPDMGCGDSVTIPFMIDNSQHPFIITFAPNSPQSYIGYRLVIANASDTAAEVVG